MSLILCLLSIFTVALPPEKKGRLFDHAMYDFLSFFLVPSVRFPLCPSSGHSFVLCLVGLAIPFNHSFFARTS